MRKPLSARTCALPACDVEFTPIRDTTRCCSEVHGKRWWKLRASISGYVDPNAVRGDSFVYDRARAFYSVRGVRWCSRECARRNGKAIRRARQADANCETVSPRRVYERDGWRCHLCGKLARAKHRAPHPLSPTLDHLVPLGRGGDHTYANVRTAHFLCNARKGDRGGGEQLAMIG